MIRSFSHHRNDDNHSLSDRQDNGSIDYDYHRTEIKVIAFRKDVQHLLN